MRLRSVNSGLFTGIPSLRRITRLFQTLNEANQMGVLNSYVLFNKAGAFGFSVPGFIWS